MVLSFTWCGTPGPQTRAQRGVTARKKGASKLARTAAQESSFHDSYLRPAGMLQLFSSASMRIVDWYTFDCLKSVAAT